MANFKEIVNAPAGSMFVLQGNSAFALGVVHAGYHAATGYPGTPSTEVIDKCLVEVQDTLVTGWSVNEAVAVSTGLGHAIAGHDTVVTMKIPGVFQAADAITTTAFFQAKAGALVIYAVTDYVPTSTQHVIDARYFFASSCIPVLEPRTHQEMYDMAAIAADISREHGTPVVVLASGLLAHSEANVVTRAPRTIEPRALPTNVKEWMLLPGLARAYYNRTIRERIPGIRAWGETSDVVTETRGTDKWGVIVSGATEIVVREALRRANLDPSVLSVGMPYPLPEERVKKFAASVRGKLIVIEEGYRFLEERVRLLGVDVIAKREEDAITDWTPDQVLALLAAHVDVGTAASRAPAAIAPLSRPPSLCPGCCYKAFALAVARLKKQKKIYAAFGDIGCSTLLYYFDALDTVSCMGASDAIRQGFVLSRPDMAAKVISVIGDSTECHSGLDATRNGVFRNVPGVKVILDNYTTAMTGGQPAPSSPTNLAGEEHKFDLVEAVVAQGQRTVVVDAFDMKAIERALKEALALVEHGEYSTLVLQGACIHDVAREHQRRTIEIDAEKCKECDLCDICPGIETDGKSVPVFTDLCTDCGEASQVCVQRCPFDAIVPMNQGADVGVAVPRTAVRAAAPVHTVAEAIAPETLPDALRVAVRGVGGQGNLFFGRVLTELALRTPYAGARIVKGETHGMAQLGGAVISTFGCGDVYAPMPTRGSVDVLVAMEESEVLRPGFLELLKDDGAVIINTYATLPLHVKKDEYPSFDRISAALGNARVVAIDAYELAREIGDTSRKSANVIILGLLSTLSPFDRIPDATWHQAIGAASPNDAARAMNAVAFERGRTFAAERVREIV